MCTKALMCIGKTPWLSDNVAEEQGGCTTRATVSSCTTISYRVVALVAVCFH